MIKALATLALLFINLLTIKAQDTTKLNFQWLPLADGISYAEVLAPKQSIVNDSKITVVKIKPKQFDFYLLTASEQKRKARTAKEWADTFQLNVVINAGMYNVANMLSNDGYMQNYTHFNNPIFKEGYNGMMAFHAKDSSKQNFAIVDLNCAPWDTVKNQFYSYAQCMRMIDCEGVPLSWDKKKQACSMLIAAHDSEQQVYFIFNRSPYTHKEMIQFMLQFPFKITNAVYLEGGPEASLYLNIGNKVIGKMGSYISTTYPTDSNHHFWKIPNVIGLRLKQ
ncbi:MAG: hypothetical protein RL060_905 [Bacteroidota bacterium]